MVDFVVFSLETGSHSQRCAYLGHVWILAILNAVAARRPTFSPVKINMKGHFIFLLSLKNVVIRLEFHSSCNTMLMFLLDIHMNKNFILSHKYCSKTTIINNMRDVKL